MKISRPYRDHFAVAEAGSILIYVLWLSALLGLFTLSIGYTARQKLEMIARIDAHRSMRLAADSGVQRALWAIHRPKNHEKKSDSLSDVWSGDERIFKAIEYGQTRLSILKKMRSDQTAPSENYGLIDEESKVNVNLLRESSILKRLLILTAGSTEEEAGVISDSVLDWIDEDEHVNAAGAENQFYRSLKRPLVPKNAPLDVLEELLYIRGMTPAIYRRISSYLTLYGDGKINLNTAPKPVLLAVGLNSAVVDLILFYRTGPDGKMGTRDDGVFYHPAELTDLAEKAGIVNEDSKSELEDLLSRGVLKVSSDYYEVLSLVSRKGKREILTAKSIVSREEGIQSWNEQWANH